MNPTSMAVEAWAVLEEQATALSAPNLSAADLREARAINEAMAEFSAAGDHLNYTVLAFQFHDALYARCPNQRLLELTREQALCLREAALQSSIYSAETVRDTIWEHRMLLDLIESRGVTSEVASYARAHRLGMVRTARQDDVAAAAIGRDLGRRDVTSPS